MTDSARRGGQQARARVRPLDRWPQHCAPMTGVAAKSIAVLMCRGCRSNCSARAAPAARGCPSGDGRGLPDIGYHREHGALSDHPDTRHRDGVALWSPMMAVGQGAGHDRAQQAGPQGDPRSQRRVAEANRRRDQAQPCRGPGRRRASCVSHTMSELVRVLVPRSPFNSSTI